MLSFSPDVDKFFELRDLNFSTSRQDIFSRLINTVRTISRIDQETFFLTHSLQVILLPVLFRRKRFVWICQGVEILGMFKFFDIFIHKFFRVLFNRKNLDVQVVNKSLEILFNRRGVDCCRDRNIWIDWPAFKRLDEIKDIDMIFVLRKERCKNSALAIQLLRKFDLMANCTVVNLSNSVFGFRNEITSLLSSIELSELLKRSKVLVYTSYFEGYGLLVKEAMAFGVTVIVGPEVLLGYESKVGFVRISSYNLRQWQKTIENLLEE
jgi:glycosyltransferase involved in cell wall biosynthesis